MSNLKFTVLATMLRLKPALRGEISNDSYRQVLRCMSRHYKDLDAREPGAKGIMRYHRMMLMTALSLYRALQEVMDDKYDNVELVHRVVWNLGFRQNTGFAAYFVRRSKNPYENFLKFLGPRNVWFFPCPPWEKVEVELENGIGWDQKKCPMYEFFKRENAVELTRAYCDLDYRIAGHLPDHVDLKRERTLALGDESCDFYYYRK